MKDRFEIEMQPGQIVLIGYDYDLAFGVIKKINPSSYTVKVLQPLGVYIENRWVRDGRFALTTKVYNHTDRCMIVNDQILMGFPDQNLATQLKQIQQDVQGTA
jgi:hypothetical protein